MIARIFIAYVWWLVIFGAFIVAGALVYGIVDIVQAL